MKQCRDKEINPWAMYPRKTSTASLPDSLKQAVFLYDYEQERGTLHMGDAGWEHPYAIVDGKVPGLMLNHPEQLWLSACWEASGALKAVREQIREERRRKHQ